MTRAPLPPGVVMAPPLWAIDADANELERVRRAYRRQVEADLATAVTKHPAYYGGDPVTASARSTLALAERAGMATRFHVGLAGCTVEGRVPGQRTGFSVTWSRGKVAGAIWYEPTFRYGTIYDERPSADATVTRTVKGKATQVADPRRMPRGLSRDHVVVLGSPYGVPVSAAELTKRIKGAV